MSEFRYCNELTLTGNPIKQIAEWTYAMVGDGAFKFYYRDKQLDVNSNKEVILTPKSNDGDSSIWLYRDGVRKANYYINKQYKRALTVRCDNGDCQIGLNDVDLDLHRLDKSKLDINDSGWSMVGRNPIQLYNGGHGLTLSRSCDTIPASDFDETFKKFIFSSMDRIVGYYSGQSVQLKISENKWVSMYSCSQGYMGERHVQQKINWNNKKHPCSDDDQLGKVDYTTLSKKNSNSLYTQFRKKKHPKGEYRKAFITQKSKGENLWRMHDAWSDDVENAGYALEISPYYFQPKYLEDFLQEHPEFAYYCCAPQSILSGPYNQFCGEVGLLAPPKDSTKCDAFMKDYCKYNKDQSVCGCYTEPDPDPDDTNWIIYNYFKNSDHPEAAVKSCLSPKCTSIAAYKDKTEYGKKCQEFCGVIENIRAGDYAYIDVDNVTYNVSCGNNDKPALIRVECSGDEDCPGTQICDHSNFKCIVNPHHPDPDPEPQPDPDPEPAPEPNPDGTPSSNAGKNIRKFWDNLKQNKLLFAGSIILAVAIILILFYMIL